jgi:uncharacterized protein YkwD
MLTSRPTPNVTISQATPPRTRLFKNTLIALAIAIATQVCPSSISNADNTTATVSSDSMGDRRFDHSNGPWNPADYGLDPEQTQELVDALDAIIAIDDSDCSYKAKIETFEKIFNEFRERLGFNTVLFNTQLETAAQIWANQMAKNGKISHSKLSANTGDLPWILLGENVSVAPSSYPLIYSLALQILSKEHLEIITNPEIDEVGIAGTIVAGKVFVALKTMVTDSSNNNTPNGLVNGPNGQLFHDLKGQDLVDAVKAIAFHINEQIALGSQPFKCYSSPSVTLGDR